MIINAEILAGRRHLKQSGMITRNKVILSDCKPYSLKQMRKFILQRHGNLDRFIFNITVADMPDRVHDHLVRHHIINEFYTCGSSRPDLKFANHGEFRNVSFYLPLKRALEIYEIRLCGKAWIKTFNFFDILAGYLEDLEPALRGLLLPKCAYHGYCTEGGCKHCQLDKYEMIKNEVKIYCGVK